MLKQDFLTLLDAIETEMRRLHQWSESPPDASAFESKLPFFLDTMALNAWIQWVFVARFRDLIEGGYVLPKQCGVAPVLEEFCQKNEIEGEHWVALVQQFDRAITEMAKQ